jgi:AcrR family transcriptional regulator
MAMKINGLKEMSVTGRGSRRRPARRFGRPPKELAGEVDARILDAARRVFLERGGLAGASMDEIAALACAGKPTIYARFPNKEALFTAVVMQTVAANVARFETLTPTGATIEERLESTAATLLQWILESDTIGLMRVAIAESARLPDLTTGVYAKARERAGDAVARLLAEATQSDELGTLPAFAPEHVTATTRLFLDLLLLPLAMRALFGEKPRTLRAEIGPHVARSAALFLAALRQGGVG